MGITPLSWQEIRAWRLENELSVSLWEVQAIRMLSSEYCAEYYAASDVNRQPPYQDMLDEDFDRTAVSNKIENFFANLIRKDDEPKYIEE